MADRTGEQIVSRPEELAACCEHLAAVRQFGLDTEFVGEDSYHPRLCLIQVATPERLILIDPFTVGQLDAFWQLIVDPANEVIVHAGREEVRQCRLWAGRAPSNLFDLQIAAGLVGLPYPLGHATLVHRVLGVELAKTETLTEWRNRPLSEQQVRYAFDDVRYLLPLWRQLTARLEALSRMDWAREEFKRMTAITATNDEPAMEKWRKLRGLGTLDRRRLAVVRQLSHWREETAQRSNRPPRTILRDDLIVEIARRNPRDKSDLQVIRGLPRRDLPAIQNAVQLAQEIPWEQCPLVIEREQDPPQAALATSVLTAVLGDFCARCHLAPNLVANNLDVRLLVRARLGDPTLAEQSMLTQGWRRQHVLPDLLAVLEGRCSLRIGDLTAEAPLDLIPVELPDLPRPAPE